MSSPQFEVRHKRRNTLLYAASETDSNILYGTRFFCPDPFIFIRTASGKRYLVMSDLEIDRAKTQSTADRVLSLTHYTKVATGKKGGPPDTAKVLKTVLSDLGIHSVAVPENFPAGIADRLRRLRIRVSVIRDPFYPERLYKTPAEVKEIKKAMRATETGMSAAVKALKRSVIRNGYLMYRGKRLTAEMLKNIINTTVLSLGYVPRGTIVAPGKQGCDPHDSGSGIIRAHEPIIIDIFPRSEKSGYFGDMTRTVVRGRASPDVKKMHQTVLDGQRLALRMIRHGVTSRSVHEAVQESFETMGFRTGMMNGRMQGFFHSTGHGLGLDIHEPPRIAINNLKLERGMIVTVEPGLYYYPTGGVRIEDTVRVTRTGIENLTRFPKTLEL